MEKESSKNDVAIECTINDKRVYDSYSDNTVFIVSSREMLETVKTQLKHAAEYLEKFLMDYSDPDNPEKE